MAVARIEAHHPNILLVEKTVSRFAQDRLLAREISVVLNVKRPLLERIAQCTGAQVSSYFLQNCPLRYFWRHPLAFAEHYRYGLVIYYGNCLRPKNVFCF
jgi:hypothetical protein